MCVASRGCYSVARRRRPRVLVLLSATFRSLLSGPKSQPPYEHNKKSVVVQWRPNVSSSFLLDPSLDDSSVDDSSCFFVSQTKEGLVEFGMRVKRQTQEARWP